MEKVLIQACKKRERIHQMPLREMEYENGEFRNPYDHNQGFRLLGKLRWFIIFGQITKEKVEMFGPGAPGEPQEMYLLIKEVQK
jgi:hypothetical protein